MTFDAKVWIAAHEPPSYNDLQGTRHVGKLWSHVEYLAWLKVFVSWKEQKLEDAEYASELKRLLGSMGFTEPVVQEMLELPSVALEEMVAGFFVLQRSRGDQPKSDSSTPAPQPPSSSSQKIVPASESSAS